MNTFYTADTAGVTSDSVHCHDLPPVGVNSVKLDISIVKLSWGGYANHRVVIVVSTKRYDKQQKLV